MGSKYVVERPDGGNPLLNTGNTGDRAKKSTSKGKGLGSLLGTTKKSTSKGKGLGSLLGTTKKSTSKGNSYSKKKPDTFKI